MRKGLEPLVVTSPIVETEAGMSGGQVIAISFSADYVAQHEHGIAEICAAFGIPGKPSRDCLGADARTVTKVPDDLKFFDNLDGYAYLMFSDRFSYREPEEFTAKHFNRMLHVYDDNEDLSTAWSSNDFGVRIKTDDVLNAGSMALGQIYDAFTKNDIMIFVGGTSGPFEHPGLVLAIRSHVPAEMLERLKASDEDYLNLIDADEKTGIRQKLEGAGKRFFALSPRWESSVTLGDDTKTEYPVVYWLNPYEQDKYNTGWYTVEQLLEWIDGTGPILVAKPT